MNDLERYTTPESAQSSLVSKLPSISFYAGMIAEVTRCSLLAQWGKFTSDDWRKGSLKMLTFLEKVGVHVDIAGLAHLPNRDTGPCVIIGNHMSFLETLLLPGIILPVPLTFVIKQSLLEYPVFKHVMRACNPIAVSRVNPRQDLKTVLEEGVKRLEEGLSVVVFPQATRSHEFDASKMGSIGVKLAKKAGVPVIPLALKTDTLQNGSLLKDFGAIRPDIPVKMAFREPLHITGKGSEEMSLINRFIEEKLVEWGAEK